MINNKKISVTNFQPGEIGRSDDGHFYYRIETNGHVQDDEDYVKFLDLKTHMIVGIFVNEKFEKVDAHMVID